MYIFKPPAVTPIKGRRSAKVLFAASFAIVNAFIWVVASPQWLNYKRLAHSGVQTVGRVIATYPANHNSVKYEYIVASNNFSGQSTVSFGGLPPLSEIRAGDKIPVTYWPREPAISVPGDPAELYRSWSALLFFVAPLFGLLAGGATVWRASRLQSRRTLKCDNRV